MCCWLLVSGVAAWPEAETQLEERGCCRGALGVAGRD